MDMENENSRRLGVRNILGKYYFSLRKAREKSDEFKTHDGKAIYFFWKQRDGINIAIDPAVPFDELLRIPGVEFKKTGNPKGLRFGTSMSEFPEEFEGIKPKRRDSKVGRLFCIEEASFKTFISTLSEILSGKNNSRHESVDTNKPAVAIMNVDESPIDIDADRFSKKVDSDKYRSQGYEQDPEMRRVLEKYAVSRAIRFYEDNGFKVKEFGKPFDLLCENGGKIVHVEVKGSRMNLDSISLTINEVKDAENATWQSDLFVVDQIYVDNSGGRLVPVGGVARVIHKWIPAREMLSPTEFRYQLPEECHWLLAD